ncbi:MAG: tRNA (N6-isopentenyl adenosine(37)-C2)-methylthiotransferase MiaB [Proteobacteria bacterium]|nr:tRNA (N6-isopentenyl adenosine(37)-C2)-methylthiotransferase MiaB [Pseudomonadota bacterium]
MITEKRLYIKTYGCQMNVYDSERMAQILKPLGYTLTDTPDNADIAILNTCHIREKAEQKVFSDLGRLKPLKEHDLLIAVGGCVGQAEGAEIIRQAPYVDIVFGPQTYHRLPEMIARSTRSTDKKTGPGRGIVDIEFPIESKFDSLPAPSSTQASAFLSIQEGCDKFCTFCVVPYTRGAEYSRPSQDILKEAQKLICQGVKEITLLGQNVNAYHGKGINGKEWGLGRLLYELDKIKGLERIRYTTSHPRDMDNELINAHRDINKLMPYIHLPVQSGSNALLQAMNRQHTRDFYLQIIENLRKARSDLAFSSDFIVGFPGETDQDFEETLDLIRQVHYAQAYSFKYSPRPGTPGSLMDNQIPEDIKNNRLQVLQEVLNNQQIVFNQATLNTTQQVLLEKKGRHPGQLSGRTPYMQSCFLEADEHLLGQIVPVIIKEAHPNSVTGQLLRKY